MSRRLENIFAHAIALESNQRFRNEIHCVGRHVYIVNYDRTVILRFDLSKHEAFDEPIAFYASDYDAQKFYIQNGKIYFEKRNGDYIRTKSCHIPNAAEAEALFDKYFNDLESKQFVAAVTYEITDLLDKGYGHIEFLYSNGKTRFVQRNLLPAQPSSLILPIPKASIFLRNDNLFVRLIQLQFAQMIFMLYLVLVLK